MTDVHEQVAEANKKLEQLLASMHQITSSMEKWEGVLPSSLMKSEASLTGR